MCKQQAWEKRITMVAYNWNIPECSDDSYVRFDEGDGSSMIALKSGSLLHRTMLTIICIMSALCAVGAVQKNPAKKPVPRKTSFTESELRTLAKATPDENNAGLLYTVAIATSNNVERKQEYLKVAGACLIACDKKDVYTKYVKGKLLNAAEFEAELKDDCKQCSGVGTKKNRCYACKGSGQCPACKGSGQTKTVKYGNGSFNKYYELKPCSKCKESGRCQRCDGEGTTNEKCWTCAGTGKAFSKTVAARVFHDSCNAIADGMNFVTAPNSANVKSSDKVKSTEQQNVTKEQPLRRRRHEPESRRYDRTISSIGPVKDGFGSETVDGVTFSYKIEDGEAMIGVEGKGFTAAVKNEPGGRLVVPSKLGGAPVTKIGFAAFYETKSSEIILPDGVDTIESDAFCNAKASRVVIPSSTRSVAHDILRDSTWFKHQKDGPLYLGNIFLGFKNFDSKEGVFSVREGTRVIATGAFSLTDFSEVTLPDSVSHIGDEAFCGCSKLTRITIPKHLVLIGNRAFDGCHALTTDLIFPEGAREIGYNAFRECGKIDNVTFPLSIEAIGNGAFDRCQFKSMTLPPLFVATNNYGNVAHEIPYTVESVKLIGEWTHIPKERFSGLRTLKTIVLAEDIKEIGAEAFEHCESLEEIQIPDAVERIGNSAFSDCTKLRHMKLPDQLKNIGDSLFSRCASLESVIIPPGVTNIGGYAFHDCPALKSISIPNSVDTISDSAFDKTCRLEKSNKRLNADHLAVVRKAEELFAKRCTVDGGCAEVEYHRLYYTLLKNTMGTYNFVVWSGYNPNIDCSFMILPAPDSCNEWYAAVVECTEKIKSWIRISAENKVEHVRKEIPIGGVHAYANGITRGNGQRELLRKAIREHITPLSAMESVKFTGAVAALDDTFRRYRISISMTCGDSFNSGIFSASGTTEEIDNEIVKFLTFVNPELLETARKKQSMKEDLFQ